MTERADELRPADLGWHVLSGEHLLELLRRAEKGEDSADIIFAELWANAEEVMHFGVRSDARDEEVA